MQLTEILQAYGFKESAISLNSFGSGLINNTWLITAGNKKYILQKINQKIFKSPELIAENISNVGIYLQQQHPSYLFPMPANTVYGQPMIQDQIGGYFRLFEYVENSHSIDTVETAVQAYEAAAQFGRFTSNLSGFDTRKLHVTLPDFHNLQLRFNQFLSSLTSGNQERIKETEKLSKTLLQYEGIVSDFERIKKSSDFKLRATHHDTKISNVLFDNQDKGICVIDLDTLMPGYFISDVGDMMRTYLSPVSEEEKDYNSIEIRDDFYKAVVQGYCESMQSVMTPAEIESIFYAGSFMIYMQALRFATDYLNDDIYYGSKYPGHNLIRAINQTTLLQRLLEKKVKFTSALSKIKIYA